MKIAVTGRVLLAVLSLASLPAHGAEGVASVLGQEIFRPELLAAGDEPAQLARFHDLVWMRVARHYIAERGLAATACEIAELKAYDLEFDRRDRAQRARKLVELSERLAADGLAADERERLEEFRAVLTRLALHDAGNDRKPAGETEEQAALYAPWIERWKMNKALYDQYGGIVALTMSGPVPHGAHAALIADYERRGLLRFLDSRLRGQLYFLLAQPPSLVVPGEQADFTPYWKQPIPPSYFPD